MLGYDGAARGRRRVGLEGQVFGEGGSWGRGFRQTGSWGLALEGQVDGKRGWGVAKEGISKEGEVVAGAEGGGGGS